MLIDLARTDRNVVQRAYARFRRFIARLSGKTANRQGLYKLERMFAKAAKVSNSPAQTQKSPTTESGAQYSIAESFADNEGNMYDGAVLLDTEFFDGLSPRNWGKKLREVIEKRASANPFIFPVKDENGIIQQLQFANPRDRVTKNGHSNHKVIDELSSTSDNISKLAVVHIDEIVEVSKEKIPYHTRGGKHQWLDQNGWLHRKAFVINAKNGAIYELTLDIAKAADGRHILYATNGKIKRVGNVQVNSLKIKGSGQNSNSAYSIPDSPQKSNTKFSQSDPVTDAVFEEAPATDGPATPTTHYSIPIKSPKNQTALERENAAFRTQKSPATSSGAQYMMNKNSVDIYTEEQYNNFGWASYNQVITPQERETLLSRYADYKHNNDKYPTTKWGEAVIHSSECPGVIMYVKGEIGNPFITRVVRIQQFSLWIQEEIKGEIIENERRRDHFPFASVESFYGQEILTISKARDYASFREYRAQVERENREAADSAGRSQQQRRRSGASSKGSSDVSYSLPIQPVSDPMTEEGYAEEAARASMMGVDFTTVPPMDPKMSDSEYIEKTLADPTVPEVTKRYIRENKNLYPVLTNAKLNQLAMDMLESEHGLEDIVAKVGRSEAVLPHEMCALQLAERGMTPRAEAGRMIFVSALAARKAGQTLGSIRHARTQAQYENMTPEERRATLIADYQHQATVEVFTFVNDFIDHKYHQGAGARIDQAVMAFDAAVMADKDAMNRGYHGIAQTAKTV